MPRLLPSLTLTLLCALGAAPLVAQGSTPARPADVSTIRRRLKTVEEHHAATYKRPKG